MNFVGMDKLSLLDYQDKIAVVLFAKPCNFRCPFCHNGLTVLDSNESISFEAILDYLSKRKGIVDAVVFSGGEPTLLKDLKEKITEVKNLGFLIKLDTNGTNPEVVKDLIDNNLLDYVAMDIKNSESKYQLTTSCNKNYFKEVVKTYGILLESHIPFELRTTLIQEFHSESDIKEIAITFKNAPKFYLQKFIERDSCFKKGLHEISEDQANKFKLILEEYISNVELRGY